MKRLAIFLIVTTFAGACWGQMTPKYDTYTTYSMDSNLVIYQTVVVEGYTSTPTGSCNTTCCQSSPYPPYYSCWTCPILGCVGSTHTPKVENVLGSMGGWSTGPPSDPFAYMSYQTTTSVQGQVGQGGIGSATDASVTCSVIGAIFAPPPGNPIIGGAYTKEVWIGGQLQGFCAVTRACNNTTTPLCTAPSVYVGNASCSPAWNSYWVTVKIGTGPTHCFVAFSSATSDTSQEWCTPAP